MCLALELNSDRPLTCQITSRLLQVRIGQKEDGYGGYLSALRDVYVLGELNPLPEAPELPSRRDWRVSNLYVALW